MQLTVTYDELHFFVEVKGETVRNGTVLNVNDGDLIRITSNYERNFFLNLKPIGLFDEKDDAMYQNVFTLVPESDAPFGTLDVAFPKDDKMGDAVPYSVADAHISAPSGWHFFHTPAFPIRVVTSYFRELEKAYIFGEFVRSLKMDRYCFKILSSPDKFEGIKNACGVFKQAENDYLWIYKESDDEAVSTFLGDAGTVKTESFGSLDALIDSVTLRLLKEKG